MRLTEEVWGYSVVQKWHSNTQGAWGWANGWHSIRMGLGRMCRWRKDPRDLWPSLFFLGGNVAGKIPNGNEVMTGYCNWSYV